MVDIGEWAGIDYQTGAHFDLPQIIKDTMADSTPTPTMLDTCRIVMTCWVSEGEGKEIPRNLVVRATKRNSAGTLSYLSEEYTDAIPLSFNDALWDNEDVVLDLDIQKHC